jgi:hypothetical protein
MTYNEIMAEIAIGLREIDNAPHDAHEIYLRLLRAFGTANSRLAPRRDRIEGHSPL